MMKPAVKITLVVIAVIGVTAIIAGLYLYNEKHADMSKAKPDFILTAKEIQKEFEENETAASSKYINKVIEVSGIINSASPPENILNISLQTSNEMSSVICTLEKPAGKQELKAGEEITLRGECSGFLMDVLFNNCAIIRK
jgi:hypothetical protein